MNKLLLKEVVSLIKDLDNCDYISVVKYVIYLISKILYDCKTSGDDILDKGFQFYKSGSDFKSDYAGIFNEYKIFNINNIKAEEKIFNFVSANKQNLSSENFSPAELYENLLTSKEKKNLGQVYTPLHIIRKMLYQLFEIKKIDKDIRILDPSCGGGYFLIEAFKIIKNSLENIDNRYIIENMLYGIDIDDFSIFLTKAGLFFASGCSDADFNIFSLDYLTDSFNLGKFDIVVGNPPYVGHKNSSTEYKKALYDKYSDVFYDKSDISYCFFKKSKDVLNQDGIVSFITSRYFMEALYADRVRSYIKNNFNIVSIFDFSGNKVFKGAMVSPALITLSNIGRNKISFSYVKYNEDNSKEEFVYEQDKLKDSGWTILKDEDQQLFNRIDSISNTYIQDICTIKQGIITGLDRAFIVDEKTIEKYKIEQNLLKKWIKNSNISKSGIKYNNLYLLYTNIIDCEQNYPNTIKYLSSFKSRLQNRRECIRGYRKWYELQWGRIQSDFENPKIVFPFKASGNNFYCDKEKYFCSADIYFMNSFSRKISLNYFLSYLNSDIFEFYFKCHAKKVGSNIYEYYPNKLSNIKIFLPQENAQQNKSDLGKINIEIFLKKVFNISEEEVNNIIYKYVNKG